MVTQEKRVIIISFCNFKHLANSRGKNHVKGMAQTSGFGITTFRDPIPEPATMFLFGTVLIGLAGARLRRKKV